MAFVRGLPGEFYLRFEVAETLGVAPSALSMAKRRTPTLGPSFAVTWKGRELHLYTPGDIETLRQHFHRAGVPRPTGVTPGRPGRPRRWSPATAAQRRQRYELARYHRRRAEQLRGRGEPARAAEAERRAATITAELAEQARRNASSTAA